jgi:GDP-L-fucose synthase
VTADVAADGHYSLRDKRVWVAGHRGMVGSAIVRALERRGDCAILTAARSGVDLRRQSDVEAWMARERPQAVFLAAAKVGGILANDTYPADFIYDNLAIELNVIHAAHQLGIEKLLFLGSSCIYPKLAAQPISEDALLAGPLEPTNEWYAVAKIAGIKLCQAYRRQHGASFVSAMPTNLYGPNDNFDLRTAHVLPALIRRMHEATRSRAREVVLWGTGTPRREFMHVDDLASALVFLMERYDAAPHVNVGVGRDLEIRELAHLIARTVGFEGDVAYDASKPDGTPRKLMDSSRLSGLGWKPRIELGPGVAETYAWYVANEAMAAV